MYACMYVFNFPIAKAFESKPAEECQLNSNDEVDTLMLTGRKWNQVASQVQRTRIIQVFDQNGMFIATQLLTGSHQTIALTTEHLDKHSKI